MTDESMEELQIKKLTTFNFVALATFFLVVPLFICASIFYAPILWMFAGEAFQYIGIISFLCSIVFSILAIKHVLGKVVLAGNILLLLFMIVVAPILLD
ncbi:MAG: hypothetical protein ACI35R_02345 [Bacillus sp. (in: firmicutes)]